MAFLFGSWRMTMMSFFRTILGLRTTLLSKVVRNRRLSCVLVYRRQYCASSIPLVNVMVVYFCFLDWRCCRCLSFLICCAFAVVSSDTKTRKPANSFFLHVLLKKMLRIDMNFTHQDFQYRINNDVYIHKHNRPLLIERFMYNSTVFLTGLAST